MTFSDALELMKKGKSIKRKTSKNYIKLEGNLFNIYNENKNIIWINYDFTSYDILANDWELYKETTLIERLGKIIENNVNWLSDYEKSSIRQAIDELRKESK